MPSDAPNRFPAGGADEAGAAMLPKRPPIAGAADGWAPPNNPPVAGWAAGVEPKIPPGFDAAGAAPKSPPVAGCAGAAGVLPKSPPDGAAAGVVPNNPPVEAAGCGVLPNKFGFWVVWGLAVC